MSFENSILGWGNAVGNRINNGLPKSWRILKEIDFE
jgi:NOL1/NOP2/fmu family ribosome biogenesis protein